MTDSMDARVLALAGVAQALQQVRRIAETGQSEASLVRTLLDSVFRTDADTPQAVYGQVGDVAPGLRLLHNYFRNQGQDEVLPRLALAVLQLERRFVRDTETSAKVTREVDAGLATLEVDLPAVVTTDLRLNEPRFVKLPEIMKAKAKPLTSIPLADVGGAGSVRVKVTKTEPPPGRQRGIMVKDTSELFAELHKRGLV
jgi:hypothetical protein